VFNCSFYLHHASRIAPLPILLHHFTMIHHSALSRKRLRSMKILDKSSCYVTALNDDFSSQELFDRFGKVLSFRVLKDTNPKQLYVRYTEEASAVNAVAWCGKNPSVFEDAKHGFNRYCSKFIHGKECTNEACENRHCWAETQDILTFLERVPAQCGSVSTSSPAIVPAVIAQPKPVKLEYQRVSALQDRIIDDLLREINDLKRVNQSLEAEKMDAAKMQQQRSVMAMRLSQMETPMVGSCSPMSPTSSSFHASDGSFDGFKELCF